MSTATESEGTDTAVLNDSIICFATKSDKISNIQYTGHLDFVKRDD